MNDDNDRIHAILDGEKDSSSGLPDEDEKRLLTYRRILDKLESAHILPPEGFTEQVIAALPDKVRQPFRERIRSLWPSGQTWITPVLAGAMAAVIIMMAIPHVFDTDQNSNVTFELHAPTADRVELIGSFNNWERGEIFLEGPDASGYWSVTVPLHHGRHEYLFVVDGKEFLADPSAPYHRPDGFGRINAILDI